MSYQLCLKSALDQAARCAFSSRSVHFLPDTGAAEVPFACSSVKRGRARSTASRMRHALPAASLHFSKYTYALCDLAECPLLQTFALISNAHLLSPPYFYCDTKLSPRQLQPWSFRALRIQRKCLCWRTLAPLSNNSQVMRNCRPSFSTLHLPAPHVSQCSPKPWLHRDAHDLMLSGPL